MNKITTNVLVALAAASFAGAGMAGGNKGGAGAGVSAGASANAGGVAGAHVSTQGEANANGQFQTEREFGQARAETRRSEQGMEHQKATVAPGERKGPKADAAAEGAVKALGVSAGNKSD